METGNMTSNFSEHTEMFDTLLHNINCEEKYSILDAGSGRTSLTIITEKFKNSYVDAVCFPGDSRKIDSIKANVTRSNYTVIERDICNYTGWKKYDFVFAHLLSGEAVTFGNEFLSLLNGLISVNGRYLMIIDYPEDPQVDFEQIIDRCTNYSYELVSEHVVNKNEPHYDSKGELVGRYYKGMLFKFRGAV